MLAPPLTSLVLLFLCLGWGRELSEGGIVGGESELSSLIQKTSTTTVKEYNHIYFLKFIYTFKSCENLYFFKNTF